MEKIFPFVICGYFVATSLLAGNVFSIARKNKEILSRLKSLEHGRMRDTSAFHSAIRQFEEHKSETVQIIEYLINYKHHPGKEIKHTSDIDVLHKKIEELAKKVGYEYRNESTKKIDAGFVKKK